MSTTKYIEDIRLEVPWGHVAGKIWGQKNGDHVLVVHGVMDNAGSFDGIMPLLPNNFHYVVIDLPGHGLSSPLPQGIQLDYINYVLAIRVILDKLDWKNCIYIGHSFGAQLGICTTIINPGRITKIACLDGFLPAPTAGSELLGKIKSYQDIAIQATKNSTSPLYTKEEILYALKNKRHFPLNSSAAEALFIRGTTKVGDRYSLNRDFRLRVTPSPLFTLSNYKIFLKYVRIPVYLVVAKFSWFTTSIDETAIESFKNIMGDNYTIIFVDGNHDVHNNSPEVVAPHLTEFLKNQIFKNKL